MVRYRLDNRVCCSKLGSNNLVSQRLDPFCVRHRRAHPEPVHRILQHLLSDADGHPLPRRRPHPNPGQHMPSEVLQPETDHLVVGVPGLDRTLVHLAFKVFLGLFVRERALGDGPERPLCWEIDGSRDGDRERGRCVGREMGEEIQQLGRVGPEMDDGDGDVVCPSMVEGGVNASSMDDRRRIPLLRLFRGCEVG